MNPTHPRGILESLRDQWQHDAPRDPEDEDDDDDEEEEDRADEPPVVREPDQD